MTRRPSSAMELLDRIATLYREGGFSRVASGLWTRLRNDLFFRRFNWWQRRGIHVTPVSQWSPIPDTRTLHDHDWNGSPPLHGIDVDPESQLALLESFRAQYRDDFDALPLTADESTDPGQYYTRNGTFETVDGEILYCMVREFDPDRIVQVGSGFSSRVIGQAITDGNLECTVRVTEPYRDDWLHRFSPNQFVYEGELNGHLDGAIAEQLGTGDILFVDSSHVVRTGNTLSRLLFELLPQLSDGVLVHFHDIFLPNDYPREWVLDRRIFLNEQYAVRSFLEFNDRFDVRWMSAYMHDNHPERLAAAFESYAPDRVHPVGEMDVPNSLWLAVDR